MSTTTPSVYVGTYHKYNCDSIFGKWFDLTDFDDAEEFYTAYHELRGDEEDPELMFQDWEGIPSGFGSESSVDWEFIGKRHIHTVFYFCPRFQPWTLSRTWTLPWTKIHLTTEDPGSSQR